MLFTIKTITGQRLRNIVRRRSRPGLYRIGLVADMHLELPRERTEVLKLTAI